MIICRNDDETRETLPDTNEYKKWTGKDLITWLQVASNKTVWNVLLQAKEELLEKNQWTMEIGTVIQANTAEDCLTTLIGITREHEYYTAILELLKYVKGEDATTANDRTIANYDSDIYLSDSENDQKQVQEQAQPVRLTSTGRAMLTSAGNITTRRTRFANTNMEADAAFRRDLAIITREHHKEMRIDRRAARDDSNEARERTTNEPGTNNN